MEDYLIVLVALPLSVVMIIGIYFFSKSKSKRESVDYEQNNVENEELKTLFNADPTTEVVIIFDFLSRNDQFLLKSFPNIIINHKDKFKMKDNTLSLKLNSSFHLYFSVPYLGKEAFKLSQDVVLEPGFRYRMTILPKTFVFSKPSVTIKKFSKIEN